MKTYHDYIIIKIAAVFRQCFYDHAIKTCGIIHKKQQICTNLKHCNPLQGNYRVELLHREIPVVITGNEFTEYNFLPFWLHFFPCFINVEIVALVYVMCTGNCQFVLQGLKGCFNTL